MIAQVLVFLVVPVVAYGATPDECTLLQKAGYDKPCDETTLVMPNDTQLGITDSVNSAKKYLLSITSAQAGRISNPQDPNNIYRLNNTFAVCSASFLQAYNKTFGSGSAIVVSAYRDPVTNAKAGGVPGSRHTQGLALDINPQGRGSYKTLYEFAKRNPQFGVCFPHYGWDNPHMTLATGANSGSSEAAICAAQGVTKPCSGAPQFDPNLGAYDTPVADAGSSYNTGGTLVLPGPSGEGTSFQPTSVNYSQGSSQTPTNTYTSWWQKLLGTADPAGTATLTCNPGNIIANEATIISWSCSGDGVVTSRGGTSRIEAPFATMGYLSGQGSAVLSETTSYKVQCLDMSKQVLDEATCTVYVDTSTGKSMSSYGVPEMSLHAMKNPVRWGQTTILSWDTNAAACQIKGGGKVAYDAVGTMETGRLFKPTTYVLECETAYGTEARQLTVDVEALAI